MNGTRTGREALGPSLAAATWLVALFLASHPRAPLPGTVLAAGDLALLARPFSNERRPEPPRNLALWDQALQFGPWHVFLGRELARGNLPAWNPHVGCGVAHAANDQSALVFPPNLVAALLGPAWGLFLLALAKTLAAGLGVRAFLRAHDVSHGGALAGAIAYAFSAPLVAWEGWSLSSVLALAPWLLAAIERARAPGLRPVLGIALATALVLEAGHAQMATHVALLAFVYAVARARTAGLAFLGRALAGALLGAALAAPHVLPFLDELSRSELLDRRSGGASPSLPLRLRALVAFPDLDGNPRDGTWDPDRHGGMSWIELACSAGGAALALAVAGALGGSDPRARLARRALVLGALALALGFGVPGASVLLRVPPLSLVRNHRLVALVALAVAVAAGAGADLLLERRARAGRAALVYAGLLVLLLLPLDRTPWSLADVPVETARAFRGTALAVALPVLAAVAVLAVAASRATGALAASFAGGLVALVLGVEQAVVFASDWNTVVAREAVFPESRTLDALAHSEPGDRPRALVVGGGILGFPPNLACGYDGLDVVGRYDVIGSRTFAPLRDALGPVHGDLELFERTDPRIARVLGVKRWLVADPRWDPRLEWGALAPDLRTLAPLASDEQVHAIAPPPGEDVRAALLPIFLEGTKTARVAVGLRDGAASVATTVTVEQLNEPFALALVPLERTAMRPSKLYVRRVDSGGRAWLLAERTSDRLACALASSSALADDLVPVAGVATPVLEDRRALPRVRWVGASVVAGNATDGIALLRSPSHDPRARVVLLASDVPGGAPADGSAIGSGTATLVRYETDRVDASVRADAPGWIVLADAWHPGWSATVDGAPVPIRKGDVALRAVAVPAGEHVVRFDFAPPGRRAGAILAALAAAVVTALALRRR